MEGCKQRARSRIMTCSFNLFSVLTKTICATGAKRLMLDLQIIKDACKLAKVKNGSLVNFEYVIASR